MGGVCCTCNWCGDLSNCCGFATNDDWCPRTDGICCPSGGKVALLGLSSYAILTTVFGESHANCYRIPASDHVLTVSSVGQQLTDLVQVNVGDSEYKSELPVNFGTGVLLNFHATSAQVSFRDQFNESLQPVQDLFRTECPPNRFQV